jgi:hypothetical protein
MKKKTAVFLGISACLIFTAFQMYTPKPPVPTPFLPKTFCGVLGEHKIEVASEYFGTMPDYDGLTAWSATALKPNADCSSKFNRLEVHTNLINGKPTEPFGQNPYDVVITYAPNENNFAINARANEIASDNNNLLKEKDTIKNTYETTNNEINHFKRKITYLHDGYANKVFECVINSKGKALGCDLFYYDSGMNIGISGDFESLGNLDKVQSFANIFLKDVRMKEDR